MIDDLSRDCAVDRCGECGFSVCRCECHADQDFVPLMGWMPSAEAALERRSYLDADQAIAQRMDEVG